MILYCFDLHSENYNRYNTVKRRFYYELRNMQLPESFWNTKSVLCVDETKENMLDTFFSKYKDDLTLFKGKIERLEKLY